MASRRQPKKVEAGTKLPLARKSPKEPGGKVSDLEKRLAEALRQLQTRDRDLADALEQQRATAEVLRVISSSPTDVQPVFDSIVRSAVRLCGGLFSIVLRREGDLIHFVAQHNLRPTPSLRTASGFLAG